MSDRIWHSMHTAGIVGLFWWLGSTYPVSGTAHDALAVVSFIAIAIPVHVWMDRKWRADQ